MLPDNYQTKDSSNKNRDFSNNKNLKTQKIASLFLVIFGVFLISFSFFQLNNKIRDPFKLENSNNNEITQEEKINFHLAVLENMDTDKDGLSDYEEIYVYDISPYLEDTDSDGLSDFEEIQRGSDPNCTEGEDCSIIGNIQTTIDENKEYTDVYDNNDVEITGDKTIDDALVDTIISGEVNVAVLRELMLANGFSQEELDQITDEDLEMIYIQSVVSQSESE